jgi:hypothetical protein
MSIAALGASGTAEGGHAEFDAITREGEVWQTE